MATLSDCATEPVPFYAQRRGVGLACLMVVLGMVAFYARGMTLAVLALLVEQLVYLGFQVLAAGLAGRAALWVCGVRGESTAIHLATAVAAGLGLLGIATLGLGLAGWLNQVTSWGLLMAAGLVGIWPLRPMPRGGVRAWLQRPVPLPGLWLAIAVYVGLSLVGGSLLPGYLWRPDDPHPYDVLIYHLQVPREWFEIGRIVPLEHNVYSYFPFNVEMQYLLMMHLRGGPWAAMYAAQLLSLLFAAWTCVAIWGILRPISARAAALGVGAFALTPWIVMLGSLAYVETGMIFYAAVSLAWLVRTGGREPKSASGKSMAVAGVFCGLAAGVKLTVLPMLAAPLAVAILVGRGKPGLRSLALSGVFLAATLITVSPWLARNYAWNGNPVFPLALRQLGAGSFSEEQIVRFERAHLPRADQQSLGSRITAAGAQILLDWRFGLVLLPLAGIAAGLSLRRHLSLVCLLIVAATLITWLFATHLQGRFFVLAILPAAILVGTFPRGITVICGVLIAAAGVNLIGLPIHSPATSHAGLNDYLSPAAELGRNGLFALPDPGPLMAEEIRPQIEAGRRVLLVGDGQVFWNTAPMKQLVYRTVFDVDATGARDLVDAWYGPRPATCPAEVVPVVSESELKRLGSYYGIPGARPDLTRFERKIVGP